jgi:hypothetical protein
MLENSFSNGRFSVRCTPAWRRSFLESLSGKRTSYAATRCVVFTHRSGTPFISRSQIPNSSRSEVVWAKQTSKSQRSGSKIHGASGIGMCTPG